MSFLKYDEIYHFSIDVIKTFSKKMKERTSVKIAIRKIIKGMITVKV